MSEYKNVEELLSDILSDSNVILEGCRSIYNCACNVGINREKLRFWNIVLDYGNRKNYHEAFGGRGWTDETFEPPYDIIVKESAQNMFNGTFITDMVGILERLGRKLDFSKASNMNYTFSNSRITRLPVIDISSATSITSTFRGCVYLVSIEKLVLSSTTVQKFATYPFGSCTSLTHMIVEGKIRSDFDISESSLLDKESIGSIFSAIDDNYTFTVKLNGSAVKRYFDNSTTWSTEWSNFKSNFKKVKFEISY